MKNKIVQLLIGVVALTVVTGATVSARTFAIGLSVGGASLIEGSKDSIDSRLYHG